MNAVAYHWIVLLCNECGCCLVDELQKNAKSGSTYALLNVGNSSDVRV